MYHRMVSESVLDRLHDKCLCMLGPAAKCVTCTKGRPQCDIVVCLHCFHHEWSKAEHSGHMWTVHYQATNASIVTDGLQTWLKLTMQSNMPTHEQINAALALELEVQIYFNNSVLDNLLMASGAGSGIAGPSQEGAWSINI